MTGWFRKPIEKVSDFDGLKMRIPGLAGKVYAQLGVAVRLLPGGEIFPALERGVIDAAEFVGPYQDRRMGLHKAAKNYYTTGWHEPTNVTELMINKKAWESLPKDLQAIVKAAASACNVESHAWCEAVNADALTDLVTNQGVIARPLPNDVILKLKEVTADTLESLAKADADTRKVHDAFMAFRKKHESWAAVSEKAFLSL
jgi:TRAP-type mannitol/chloroaromatic compound transport system substrate-binding protein